MSPSRFSPCPGERALARTIHDHCDDDTWPYGFNEDEEANEEEDDAALAPSPRPVHAGGGEP